MKRKRKREKKKGGRTESVGGTAYTVGREVGGPR